MGWPGACFSELMRLLRSYLVYAKPEGPEGFLAMVLGFEAVLAQKAIGCQGLRRARERICGLLDFALHV